MFIDIVSHLVNSCVKAMVNAIRLGKFLKIIGKICNPGYYSKPHHLNA